MLDPMSGPFLFDTSAEGWFARQKTAHAQEWMMKYLERHPIHVSAITVFERVRGYALLARDGSSSKRQAVERARLNYLTDVGSVWPVDQGVATTAAEICALLPHAPTGPRHAHQFVESRQERLARWRADTMIAATALATDLLLIHNNAADFEAIRGAIEREPIRFPGLGPLKLIRCASVVDSGRV